MVDARGEPGRLELHQRHEPMDFGFPRQQASQHAAKAQRFVGHLGPDPPVIRCGGIAFGEDQVQHGKYRAQAPVPLVRVRGVEGHLSGRESFLCPNDALLEGGDGNEQHPCNLHAAQAANGSQRHRGLPLTGEHGVAGGKDQPEHIIGDRLPLVLGHLPEVLGNLAVTFVEPLPAAPGIYGLKAG